MHLLGVSRLVGGERLAYLISVSVKGWRLQLGEAPKCGVTPRCAFHNYGDYIYKIYT